MIPAQKDSESTLEIKEGSFYQMFLSNRMAFFQNL